MNAAFSRRQEALVRFNSAAGVPAEAVRKMLTRLEAESLLEASPGDLAAAGEISLEAASRWRAQALAFDAKGELDRAQRLGASLLETADPGYPELLKSIPGAPLLLYVQGRLPTASQPLAFVGSRRPSPYGVRMTRSLAGEAAAGGFVIVSGLARGIDAEAHQAALRAGGATWAVLGSGLGRVYPPENAPLSREIVSSGGALISEFPLSAPPLQANFPRRNRIISGLSWGTVVVEGRERSGSLITARFALEQGREVFAVPGPADSPLSDAPHLLIRRGAKLARSLADVLEELPAGVRLESGRKVHGQPQLLDEEHQKVLQYLGPDSLTVEELGLSTGIDLPRLSTILFEMELQDLVGPVPGQRYAKKAIGQGR